MVTRSLDIRGLICPITWARVKRELLTMRPGDLLEISLDHRPAIPDIKRNSLDLGHEVVSVVTEGTSWKIVIELGSPDPE